MAMANSLRPGMICICIGRKPWKSEFIGIIQKELANSTVVLIEATHEDDDSLVDAFGGKTVISKKDIFEEVVG